MNSVPTLDLNLTINLFFFYVITSLCIVCGICCWLVRAFAADTLMQRRIVTYVILGLTLWNLILGFAILFVLAVRCAFYGTCI